MIATGKEGEQILDQMYRKDNQELISMFTDPGKQPEIKGPELDRRLRSIASRNDADSMREVFRAFHSSRIDRGRKEGKTRTEILLDSCWRMDQTVAYADARNSGIPGYELVVYSDPTIPLSKTQKFFRQAIGYNPTEPRRRPR